MIHREERKMLEFRRGGSPLLLLGEGEIVHHAICITPSLHFRRWGVEEEDKDQLPPAKNRPVFLKFHSGHTKKCPGQSSRSNLEFKDSNMQPEEAASSHEPAGKFLTILVSDVIPTCFG
ncbi:hypothetical protein TNIN_494811 [Trichonephila inaurata madagascariensis]|uniref:Uncharacterized protein n=1 Tax=Trichonephila inaurata madagascariensis TaxID=2747483 RepID=A0A8X6XN96_9ARAC|nr:hypothetical protein TNIN_494811 [Trichonephila inaurata madagascariensis]